MRAEERDDIIRELFEADMELLRAKGADYAGERDCFANLRRFGLYGIIVRLSDKFSRLESLAKKDFKAEVKDERVEDTLRDISNYCYLARAIVAENATYPDENEHTSGSSQA